jgi:hypothetical protein
MSYDIMFISKNDEQTWEEALNIHAVKNSLRRASIPKFSVEKQLELERISTLILNSYPDIHRIETPFKVELNDKQQRSRFCYLKKRQQLLFHIGIQAT